MDDKLIMIPSEFPVINLVSDIMPLPGVSVNVMLGSFIYDNLIEDLKMGRVGLILGLMSQPGAMDYPDKFYKIGVVAEANLTPDNNRDVNLRGLFRARVGSFRRHKGNSKSYWLATLDRPIRDAADIAFELINDQLEPIPEQKIYIAATLFQMKYGLRQLVRSSTGLKNIDIEPLDVIVSGFDGRNFDTYEDLDKFTWEVTAALPHTVSIWKQEVIESSSLGARMLDCLINININVALSEAMGEIAESCDSDEEPDSISEENHNYKKPQSGKKSRSVSVKDGTEEDEIISGAHPELIKRWKVFQEIKAFMNKDAQQGALDDFTTLKGLGSPEANPHEWPKYVRHLDFNIGLPWNKESAQEENLEKVKIILDEDHYSLEASKDVILDNLAPSLIGSTNSGEIMCFVGPPGVGKTSLGESIARAMNRKFIRISVGGIKDESQIRGHAFTYLGAEPGQVLKKIRSCGAKNPVFMVDEIDKMGGMSIGGDPQSAMLEVLDPKQNKSFHDHYLDAGFDLSKVLFICTANVEYTIPEPLRDRMNINRLPGYTEPEKIQIAIRHLIPRLMKEVNLAKDTENGLVKLVNITWEDEIISKIIQGYTSEAGVRNLERTLKTILRKICRVYIESIKNKETLTNFIVDSSTILNFLGPLILFKDKAVPTDIGEVYGLAWTEHGGVILKVEVIHYPRPADKKTLSITGLQGTVMKDSDYIALSIIRSRAKEFFGVEVSEKLQNKLSIHIHIPGGAIPKDGPSAGVTMFTAIYSKLSGKVVDPYLAMTGEITLTGKILPVGGILEKVIAAERAGIKKVLLPLENERNLDKVPSDVKDKLDFKFVSHVDEILPIAFSGNQST